MENEDGSAYSYRVVERNFIHLNKTVRKHQVSLTFICVSTSGKGNFDVHEKHINS